MNFEQQRNLKHPPAKASFKHPRRREKKRTYEKLHRANEIYVYLLNRKQIESIAEHELFPQYSIPVYARNNNEFTLMIFKREGLENLVSFPQIEKDSDLLNILISNVHFYNKKLCWNAVKTIWDNVDELKNGAKTVKNQLIYLKQFATS